MFDIAIFSLIIFIFGIVPSLYYLKNYKKIELKEKENSKKPINKITLYSTILFSLINIILQVIFYDSGLDGLLSWVFIIAMIALFCGIYNFKSFINFFLVFNIILFFLHVPIDIY